MLVVAARVRAIRRPQLALRVLPYVLDLPQVGRTPALKVVSSSPTTAAAGVFGPPLRSAADTVERLLGGATSVRRRLERADLDRTVHEFRVEQVLWGLGGFAVAAAYGVLRSLTDPGAALLAEAAVEVGCAAGDLPPGFEVGAMAEVPAFALHARAAVPLVDLISIGTNDLTQYTLAAERGNAGVATLADPLDPAVLYLISEVADAATARARVAVCGELAADPLAAALLIGLGVRELSMTPRAIPAVKDAVRSMSANKTKQLAALALHRDSAASVRALLSDLAEETC